MRLRLRLRLRLQRLRLCRLEVLPQVRYRAHAVHLDCSHRHLLHFGRDLACRVQGEDRGGDRGSEGDAWRAALEGEGRRLAVPCELVERLRPAHFLRLKQADWR